MTDQFASAMEKIEAMAYSAHNQAVDGGDEWAKEHLRALAQMANDLADTIDRSESIDDLIARWGMEQTA